MTSGVIQTLANPLGGWSSPSSLIVSGQNGNLGGLILTNRDLDPAIMELVTPLTNSDPNAVGPFNPNLSEWNVLKIE